MRSEKNTEQPAHITDIKMKTIFALAATALPMVAGQANSPATMSDRDVLATCLILEAGGEGRVGMELVWHVIQERVKSRRWPDTARKVVLQPKQFSCFNNVSLGRAIATAQRHPYWRHALGIVSAPPVYRQGLNPNGANHYHATTIRPPYWARGVKPTLTYRNHVFYRLK